MSEYIVMAIFFIIGMIGSALVLRILPSSDGCMYIDDSEEGKTTWTLQYDGDPVAIAKKKHVTFQVCVVKKEEL